jgi:hypothetical protein
LGPSSTDAASFISDDFEADAVGAFPTAAGWLDCASHGDTPPSGTVEIVQDAFGSNTKAFALADTVSMNHGLYWPIPVGSPFVGVSGDVRVDRYA